MKTNKLPESAWTDSQAAGSQLQQPKQSLNDNEYGDDTQQTNQASNDASYNHDSSNGEYSHHLAKDTSSQDSYFGYKSPRAKESAMSDNEISKDLKNSNEDNHDVASGYKSPGYKSARNKPPQKLNEDEPLMSGLLEDQVDNLNSSSEQTIDAEQMSDASANNSSYKEIPERIFMNGLIKHTGIALAIIIPLAAFSAYAATPPVNMATNGMSDDAMNEKTTTDVLSVKPSDIIHKSASTPTTVDSVDLNTYAGTWYEIGRLPMYFQRKCAGDVTANYAQKDDGSGITVTNKCVSEDGSGIVAEGLAKPVDESGSKLKVTFLPKWIRWIPVGRADYWVLARDAEYKTALVGTPDKKYLWLLARSPNISQETYTKYRQIAQQQGYDLKEFTLTSQSNQTVSLAP
ncbi:MULTISPECIES: lipocalin family protein [Psychrobacter]|uniref:lipocalin family protein n=1 Tax=Psychrobacter TaxID=497 RepID=UPI000A6B318E|nr:MULTISPECIES: lipocalin family protein [Psychrobacter]MBA6243870.1 lipocalin family protein [Psychrobacter sp. Urea-trap-18]MBA6285453.1 lipocalin family protein [Psychrobacter sp. Urea-trap-16]MBA6319027.1 lipocalin family protein [Psychrobacter sp. Urea-trap-20]MBA6335046.1 lipocalin family protein [Psychrobacter sp. Urea-trap-19]PKG59577.1 lipocalin [Psychrobacter sp. Choline-3u-12]|tara:strand:+ start:5094 stop:6299 length:1206 start_codon:yes stop_codon:yes gene_type:complete